MSEKPCRILVVDDNADAAHALARLLAAMGMSPVEAHSGPAALTAIEAAWPDLIFLDLSMAGMDGYETAAQIRSRFSAEIPLVALTGLSQEKDREQTQAAGFVAHLVKPVKLELLEATLKQWVPSSCLGALDGE